MGYYFTEQEQSFDNWISRVQLYYKWTDLNCARFSEFYEFDELMV